MKRKKAGSTKLIILSILVAVIRVFTIFVCITCIIAMAIAMVLSGCFYSSSAVEEAIVERNAAADEEFEKEYEAAKKKYEKYYDKVVSGQEVLDLIDNWDDPELGMLVENIEDTKFEVSNLDIDNTRVTYWDKDSEYYIDPNAYYKASFMLYENPRKESDKRVTDLIFYLVEDSTMSDDDIKDN